MLRKPRDGGAWWLVGIAPIAFGFLSIWRGQDANWDLLNYHYYNPYAFLTGRFDQDFAPAQLQTYYNPLLHIPFFWLLTYVPPKVTAFVLGTIQGANLYFLVAIAQRIIGGRIQRYEFAVACFLALVGMLGAGNISELGTAMGDNLISLFILGSLLVLLSFHDSISGSMMGKAAALVGGAGIIAGFGVGLKLTNLIFAIGLVVGLVMAIENFKRRSLLALSFTIGASLGLFASAGFWFYGLWARFDNPLFPYFNSIFQSPWAGAHSYRDFRFLPKGFLEALIYPLVFLIDYSKVAEVSFRDLRIPLIYLCLFFVGLSTCAWGIGRSFGCKWIMGGVKDRGKGTLILGCVAGAYLVWLKLFGIYRYLIVLEMLAPIVLWIAVMDTRFNERTKTLIVLSVCVLLLLTTQVPNWGRKKWGGSYFDANIPTLQYPAQTLVVIGGSAPLSHLVPLFPGAVRFVRLESNFFSPEKGPKRLIEALTVLLRQHRGPLYALFDVGDEARTRRTASHYGISIDNQDCAVLEKGAGPDAFLTAKFCRAQ